MQPCPQRLLCDTHGAAVATLRDHLPPGCPFFVPCPVPTRTWSPCAPTLSPQGEGGRGVADPAGKHPKVSIMREVDLQDGGEEVLRGILAKPGERRSSRGLGNPDRQAGRRTLGQATYQVVSWLLSLPSHCPSLVQEETGSQCSVAAQRTVQFRAIRLPSASTSVSLAAGARSSGGTLQRARGTVGREFQRGKPSGIHLPAAWKARQPRSQPSSPRKTSSAAGVWQQAPIAAALQQAGPVFGAWTAPHPPPEQQAGPLPCPRSTGSSPAEKM